MKEEPLLKPLEEERLFEFPTSAGTIAVRATNDVLTPFGGLVPFSAFLLKSEMAEKLAETSPAVRSSPNALPVRDIVLSFMLTALCDGRRFSHVGRLREDASIGELFGMKRGVCGTDAILRFLHSVPEDGGREWVAAASKRIWTALPEDFILDWDSTVMTKYGHQEGSEIGYNPQKHGRASQHPLLAVAAGTRLCPYYRWRGGKSASSTEWLEAMDECLAWLGGRKPWLNRADLGFAHEDILAWHEVSPERPKYLMKLKMTRNVRRAIPSMAEEAWQGSSSHGVLQVAETRLLLSGWSKERRVIVGRRLRGIVSAAAGGTFWDEAKHEFEAYVTNLSESEASPWQIVDLYRKRADAENVFDELKNQWGFAGFCSGKKEVTALAARLQLLTYNLWNLFLRLMEPSRHIEAFQGRRWFLLIAARLVERKGRKELQISTSGAWWRDLSTGYRRLSDWLKLTASQLDFHALSPPVLSR